VPRPRLWGCAPFAAIAALSPVLLQSAFAQSAPSAESAVTLPRISVTHRAKRPPQRAAQSRPAAPVQPRLAMPVVPAPGSNLAGLSPDQQRYQLPQTAEGITARRIEQTVNIVDSEDAVKYLPSLSLRKRNAGDNQTVLASRVWGLNSSARTLIYADDILLSALIANNNTSGTPRWSMISPEEIARVDFLYGPFAAIYPGNSMGGVLKFTTRMPEKFEATLKQSESFQNFSFYNTSGTFRTDQTNASVGNRWGDLSALVTFNHQNSYSQPLGFATTTANSFTGVNGLIQQPSRTGGVANVMGATGLLHTEMTNVKGKFALDITPWLTATYTLGFWSNDQASNVDSFLRNASGATYYGTQGTGASPNPFATSKYNLNQQNLANALAFKTDTKGNWDWDLIFTRHDYLQDIQRSPFNVTSTGFGFTDAGRIARMDGSNWTTVDAKGIWRPTGPGGAHEVSFGYHFDNYTLNNPVYRTNSWTAGPDFSSQLYSNSRGKTETHALWLQDAWRFAPLWKLTLGGRAERWRAFDGFNLTTVPDAQGNITGLITALNQPSLGATRFSPKGTLSFEPSKQWEYTASVGIANRFPTVTELYQSTIANGTVFFPSPNLKPEQSLVTELAAVRKFTDGKIRLSLFQENTKDMIISQQTTLPNSTTLASFNVNVDEVQNRGVELAVQKDNVFVPRLELFGSATYVDSVILSNPSFVSTTGTTSTGKMVPNVPKWRATFGGTYRPTDQWSFTVVGRYQSKIYSTLDNTDNVAHVYQAFDPYLVFDMRVQYQVSERGSLAFGIDNIFNEKYVLFHPFPQRTYVVQGKLTF
jgi:iron complex outermembrane receptor protein